MSFTLEFISIKNSDLTLTIFSNYSYIIWGIYPCTTTYNIDKIYLLTKDNGKFSINNEYLNKNFIIKYSKQMLIIYDSDNNIIDTYKLKTNINLLSINSKESNTIKKFIISKNKYLYLDIINKQIIIYSNSNNCTYTISKTYTLGDSIVYETNSNNKLILYSNKISKKSTWNGISIDLITSNISN